MKNRCQIINLKEIFIKSPLEWSHALLGMDNYALFKGIPLNVIQLDWLSMFKS